MRSYDDTLLRLKPDVWFFAIKNRIQVKNKENEVIMQEVLLGKIFYDRTIKRHASPNETGSMILYLLARDLDDEIHSNTLKDLVLGKFSTTDSEVVINDLVAFLGTLETCFSDNIPSYLSRSGENPQPSQEKRLEGTGYGILDKFPAGRHPGTLVPDPVGLFNERNPMAWVRPELNQASSGVISTRSHFYCISEDGVNGWTKKI